MEVIPGVIVLNENKTYGKYKKDKLLYKCVPDDKRLPIFLIPYKKKNNFNKNTKNKYVIFKFKNWDGKHPVATDVNTLGDTDQLDNFYEYQLYCKSLYASIQNITKKAMQKLKVKTSDEYINLIKEKNLKNMFDVLERAGWTFAQAFLGVFVVADLSSAKGAGIAGLAAAVSVLKTIVKDKVAKH